MSNWPVFRAARAVRRGGVIAYPTEAVYGLGCDPRHPRAVERILSIKRRPVEKGLILIAATFAQLEPYLLPLPTERRDEILASWPGPVTWVLPARSEVPVCLRGAHESLAVRVTAHPLAAQLCKEARTALVSTSANRAGHPPATDATRVRRWFGREVDFILNGPLGGQDKPTEIRDGRTGKILRAG